MVPELEEETSNAEEGQVMSWLSEGKAGTLMQLSGKQQLFGDRNRQKGKKKEK